MAQFEFKITSDDAGEMSALMDKLFGRHSASAAPAATRMSEVAPDDGDPMEDAQEDPPAIRRNRTKAAPKPPVAKVEPEPEVAPADASPLADEADDEPEVTLNMVKDVGSKAMGVIKASGVAAIFQRCGNGAESFGALPPETYAAVHAALTEAIA